MNCVAVIVVPFLDLRKTEKAYWDDSFQTKRPECEGSTGSNKLSSVNKIMVMVESAYTKLHAQINDFGSGYLHRS